MEMKMMRFVVAGLLSLALVSVGSGQMVQKLEQAIQDERELKRLEDQWLGSYLRGDKATFDRIVAESFTGTDESAIVRSKAQERELIQAPPASVKTSLTNEDVQVRIYGDTAIVTGRIVVKTQFSGQAEINFQTRFTDTFLRRQERWQVVARHYSRLPVERTVVKVDPKVYDQYVGQYELAPNFVLTVTKEGEKLKSQATGQPQFELLPVSEFAFFIKDISALFIFMRGPSGEVDQMLTVQGGRIIQARRVK
jgi:ketosteroid isomerase-like protein